ncbi:hypothetical protein PoB_005171200 [Plakobranchus ocellatus]|uniref:Uncharacterized protein n=1 Tax=Plakobranchus ocellatus TaxID=259542 RepID=A0AAV4C1I6_9GAST|nr:hypothetical protein PoB_005171200 [Plakobranchus ocellatus]
MNFIWRLRAVKGQEDGVGLNFVITPTQLDASRVLRLVGTWEGVRGLFFFKSLGGFFLYSAPGLPAYAAQPRGRVARHTSAVPALHRSYTPSKGVGPLLGLTQAICEENRPAD